MKRVLLGTLLCLVIVVALLALASRWATLFWLLVLAMCLYLLFGRKVERELRVGVGGDGVERRVYVALIWKRGAAALDSAEQSSRPGSKLAPPGGMGDRRGRCAIGDRVVPHSERYGERTRRVHGGSYFVGACGRFWQQAPRWGRPRGDL